MAYTPATDCNFGDEAVASRIQQIIDNQADHETRIATQTDADFSAGSAGRIWWEELGRTTLGSAGDTITVSSFGARNYLKLIYQHFTTGGTQTAVLKFNNDSGTNYATRASSDQGATGTATSGTSISIQSTAFASDVFAEISINNYATKAKAVIIRAEIVAGGATVAPGSRDVYAKWVNTSSQITTVSVTNGGSGDFAIGSELIVLGHD